MAAAKIWKRSVVSSVAACARENAGLESHRPIGGGYGLRVAVCGWWTHLRVPESGYVRLDAHDSPAACAAGTRRAPRTPRPRHGHSRWPREGRRAPPDFHALGGEHGVEGVGELSATAAQEMREAGDALAGVGQEVPAWLAWSKRQPGLAVTPRRQATADLGAAANSERCQVLTEQGRQWPSFRL